MKALIVACVVGLLGGCSLGPQPKPPVAGYDFGFAGPARALPRLPAGLAAGEVSGPAWMETTALVYRLGYRDASRPQPYAFSRWVAPPGQLVAQRLRQRLLAAGSGERGPGTTERVIDLELDHFGQLFDAPDRSRAMVQARAGVRNANRREPYALRSFTVEVPAATPDAEGGAHALAAAADELVLQVLEWAATTAGAGR